MTGMATGTTVREKQGALRGERADGYEVFRCVPYAAPAEKAARFAPPQPAPSWNGVRDATSDGPIAPQNRSRLAHIMGDFERAQSEDCLSLTIWCPDPVPARCPVLVWLHGGAFTTGAGSLPWYSGESFARSGLILVSVNYRLGALGFLAVPGRKHRRVRRRQRDGDSDGAIGRRRVDRRAPGNARGARTVPPRHHAERCPAARKPFT